VISTQALELRAGARLLVKGVTVRINSGDRIGFVGRNGAGKSTLAKVLAGENMPAGGALNRTGKICYLPQEPRTGDEPGTVIDRILSARDLDQIAARMRSVEEEMATAQGEALEKAMDRYGRVESDQSFQPQVVMPQLQRLKQLQHLLVCQRLFSAMNFQLFLVVNVAVLN